MYDVRTILASVDFLNLFWPSLEKSIKPHLIAQAKIASVQMMLDFLFFFLFFCWQFPFLVLKPIMANSVA
jgi:hypothetical protein